MSKAKFNDERFAELDKKWSIYRDRLVENPYGQKCETYQKLMLETFPVLYEAWNKDKTTVCKDAAKLLTTMGNLFESCYDEDGNFMGASEIEDISMFHSVFLQSFIYFEEDIFDKNGNIVLNGGEFEVDINTFVITYDP